MDEGRLTGVAEQLLVFAGCVAEDLAPTMVTGGRDPRQLRADTVVLRQAAERLAVLAQAAEVLLTVVGEETAGNLEEGV